MFHAPPFLLILTLTLVYSPIFHAIPVSEEQRHQTFHRTTHSEAAHPPQPEGHQEAPPLSRSQHDKVEAIQERATSDVHSPSSSDDGDELFKDISPKALAAVLLQALNTEEGEQVHSPLAEKTSPVDQEHIKEEVDKEDDDGLIERVKSRTRSSDKEDELREDEKMDEGGDMESVKSLLEELEGFEPPPKREQDPTQDNSPESEDLQELRELLGFGEQTEEEKRSPLNPVPHTPQRWEEEEEGGKLANVAQDLLLQYLMSGGENEVEKEEVEDEDKENGQDYPGEDFVMGQRPLFEDEEQGNIQDKRSTEDYGEEVDPQTIDKLIELSSRLHLPADDVVDIISDVEKRKRRRMKKKKARDDLLGRKERTRTPPQSWPDSPKYAYYPRRRFEQEPTWNKVPETSWKKASAPIWNKNKMSGSNWNKMSEPTWNKASWNKVSEPSWNKVPEPSWNKVSDQSWNKVPDQSWNKVPDQSWNKVPDQSWNKVPDQSWNKVSDQSWNKVPDQSWNKVSNQNWNKVSEPRWKNLPETNWNRLQEPTWNKVSPPNWNKVMEPIPRRYRTRPAPFTNYIRPRAYQNPPRYYYKPPVPQRDDYFDDQDKQEEMENYIERILLTHPEVFQ